MAKLWLRDVQTTVGHTVSVPLGVTDDVIVVGYALTVLYDPDHLTLSDIAPILPNALVRFFADAPNGQFRLIILVEPVSATPRNGVGLLSIHATPKAAGRFPLTIMPDLQVWTDRIMPADPYDIGAGSVTAR